MGKGKRGNAGGSGASGAAGFSVIDVDPRRVRYAHSKIKPVFSGCGRTIEQTLQEIRDGKTLPSDLPAITVLLGPADPADGGGCYFSLNNRRLFVLKAKCPQGRLWHQDSAVHVSGYAVSVLSPPAPLLPSFSPPLSLRFLEALYKNFASVELDNKTACREEGLLGANGLVAVRARPMKPHERERYTVDRCSLRAKFLFAPKPSATGNRLDVAEAEGRPTGQEIRTTGGRNSPPDPEISGREVLESAQDREGYGSSGGETGALGVKDPETRGACDGRAGRGRSKTRGESSGGSKSRRRNRRQDTRNEGVAVAAENAELDIGGIEISRKLDRSQKGRVDEMPARRGPTR